MTDPLVSIVIVTHGAWDWAERAIAAAVANTDVPHEIVVVDNASPEDLAGRVRERFPDVRLLVNDDNAGFGAANNQAAEVARGEYLALLNSDAVVPAGWVGPLLEALRRPGVGAVVPALTNEDGTMQMAGALVAPDGSVLALGNGDDVEDPAWRFPRATDFGPAACMLLRRDAFLDAGGFLDAYNPAYFEDTDLCLTLLEQGLRTLYVPDVRVLHGGFASGGEPAAAKLFERNRPVFVGRWGKRLAATHPPTLWPPDPARTLAARDALATGRALVVGEEIPSPTGELGAAVASLFDDLPWARVTIAGRSGDPEPWWRMGVEVLVGEHPEKVAEERAGHYDVVAAIGEFESSDPLAALRALDGRPRQYAARMAEDTPAPDAPAPALGGRPCVVCGAPVRIAIVDWAARCPECGTWTSSLEPAINEQTTHATTATEIDDEARAVGLEQLRRDNYRQILDRVGALVPLDGARLLDIGSAHGWFLEEAEARGVRATGVEPEESIAAESTARGLEVRTGYFPDVVPESGEFDVVSFNDVLEHIPDARGTLEACLRVLRPGGVISINIPSADGLGYRVASGLARAGSRGSFERFWQHGLPSPHVHYFTRASLSRLMADCGFQVAEVDALAAIVRHGLWDRVHTFRRTSPASVASFAALWAAAPILNRPRNSDIVLALGRRPAA